MWRPSGALRSVARRSAPPVRPIYDRRSAPADTLQVVGDCDALYIATGDQYEPWVLVEARPLTATITVYADRTRDPASPDCSRSKVRGPHCHAEPQPSNRVRKCCASGGWSALLPTEWQSVAPGDPIDGTVQPDTERDRFRVTVTDHPDEFVAAAEWDAQRRRTTSARSASPFLPSSCESARRVRRSTAVQHRDCAGSCSMTSVTEQITLRGGMAGPCSAPGAVGGSDRTGDSRVLPALSSDSCRSCWCCGTSACGRCGG